METISALQHELERVSRELAVAEQRLADAQADLRRRREAEQANRIKEIKINKEIEEERLVHAALQREAEEVCRELEELRTQDLLLDIKLNAMAHKLPFLIDRQIADSKLYIDSLRTSKDKIECRPQSPAAERASRTSDRSKLPNTPTNDNNAMEYFDDVKGYGGGPSSPLPTNGYRVNNDVNDGDVEDAVHSYGGGSRSNEAFDYESTSYYHEATRSTATSAIATANPSPSVVIEHEVVTQRTQYFVTAIPIPTPSSGGYSLPPDPSSTPPPLPLPPRVGGTVPASVPWYVQSRKRRRDPFSSSMSAGLVSASSLLLLRGPRTGTGTEAEGHYPMEDID